MFGLFSGKVGFQGNGKKIVISECRNLPATNHICQTSKLRENKILHQTARKEKVIITTILPQKKTFAQDSWDGEDKVFKRKLNQFCINQLNKLQKYNLQKDYEIPIRRHFR